MRQKTSLTLRKLDRRAEREYQRPFVRAVLLFVVFSLFVGGFLFGMAWLQRREYGAAKLQLGEATCVKARVYMGKTSSLYMTTYRINGVERTTLDRDGCFVGRHYALSYRVGRSGHLKIVDSKLL